MNTASILIKTNPETKTKAQETARELGFSLSSVINGFLKQFIRTKTISFSADDEIPNEHFKKTLNQAMKDLDEGKASPVFHNADEMIKWLHRQDVDI